MKNLCYTQQNGFVEYEDVNEWKDKEDECEFLKRIGYSDELWMLGCEQARLLDTTTAKAYRNINDAVAMPYLVTVWDICYGTHIYVPDNASLFALRIKLASLIQADVVTLGLESVVLTVTRFFRAQHGHDYYSACRECDPDEIKIRENERKRIREAREAREREAKSTT